VDEGMQDSDRIMSSH